MGVRLNQSREKRTELMSISGVSSQQSWDRSWISLRRGLDDLVSIIALLVFTESKLDRYVFNGFVDFLLMNQ